MQIDCMRPVAHSRNWSPSFFVLASMFTFAGSLAATLWRPGLWPWTASLIGVNHIVLAIAGLWPRSQILGVNWICLPPAAAQRGEVAITLDDGPDPEVTPRVLDILDHHNAKATFFCIGALAERHPDLCREVVRRGHVIENHSQRHKMLFSMFGPLNIYREIRYAQDTLTRITGQTPRFFRPPAGLRNPLLDAMLPCLGLHLVSWSRRGFDTRETDPEVVLKKLSHGLKGGDILLLHDGNAARTPTGTPVILHVLPRLLDILAQANLHPVTLRSTLP